MKTFRLTIIFLFFSNIFAYAAMTHSFYGRFSSWDGLPESPIASVCQDNFGRIWVGTRDGVFIYSGEHFLPFNNKEYLDGCTHNTGAIAKDNQGHIWISTSDGTGFYDTYSDKFTILKELAGQTFRNIEITTDGQVWLTSSQGVWKYSKKSGTLMQLMESSSFSPYRTCVTEDGKLVITARDNCIYLIDPDTGNITQVRTDRSDASYNHIEYLGGSKVLINDGNDSIVIADYLTGLTEKIIDSGVFPAKAEVQCLLYQDGLYWIGANCGLLIYDPDSRTMEMQFPNRLNMINLGGESVRTLFCDSYDNIWAGTWNGGLRCCIPVTPTFSRFSSQGPRNALPGGTIRSICEDPYGYIWVGSESGYLSRYDRKNQQFDDYSTASGISLGTIITDISCIDSQIWISTFGEGITIIDPVSKRPVRKYSLPNNQCMTVIKTSDGEILAGTHQGLFLLDRSTDSFKPIDAVGTSFVHSLLEDNNHNLYISTYYHGFGVLDLETFTFKKVSAVQQEAISSFTMDSRGTLWATTDGAGILKIKLSPDGRINSLKHFNKNSGLPSNSCSSITEDNDGHLWIGTSTGLVEFDPDAEKVIRTYMQADNVIGRNFTFGSNCKTSDGTVLMGTAEGLLEFSPEYFKERFAQSKIHITDITLGSATGQSSITQQGRSSISSETIHVKQKDAGFISITFSSLDYFSPGIGDYKCTLTGKWINSTILTEDSHIVYTGLRPGTYHFTVNYEDSIYTSTEDNLEIIIKAPWYFSAAAQVIYILVILFLGIYIMKRVSKKNREMDQHRMELMDAKKEKEMAQEKMSFFTNIAHEIRTPVSVLQILLDKQGSEQSETEIKKDNNSMRLNVDRLKKLCDDLLDFRKLDSGQVRMVSAQEDICAIVRKDANSFESATKARKLDFSVEYSKDSIMTLCDADAVESVICNLISNAIKYAEKQIKVKVSDEEDKVVIRVNNDGIRIPDEESELIFKAFYQSKSIEKNGTGLGLTYSRKIANLHNGKLYLDTDVKDTNSFVFELPLITTKPTNQIETAKPKFEEEVLEMNNEKAIVLIVEDNETMRELIRDTLSKEYATITACDGQEALEIVKSTNVDLVISDIMMPKMNGCELCDAIKSDISLSHLPVLLLTAAVGVETHIRSLKSGADAYIEKPFKVEVLKAYLSNLLRNRDIRNEQFSSSPLSHYSFSSVSKVELDFMNNLHTYIIDHISDTNLTLDHLATAMNMSRATLTRKVKTDTGVTVNEYVRICRLKKAAELLAENNYRINEVAYLVGFTSPSYFTLNFQKQFGKLPSEFAKQK